MSNIENGKNISVEKFAGFSRIYISDYGSNIFKINNFGKNINYDFGFVRSRR
jgi:hypothetical protein